MIGSRGHLRQSGEVRVTRDAFIDEFPLTDGRRVTVCPLTFGRARLGVGPLDSPSFDDEW